MKITMEKLKSVLNKYGYQFPIDDTLIDMYKEMGIKIIEEKLNKLELARKLNPEEIEYRGRLYILSHDVGKMKHLYEGGIKKLQKQIQKMKCCDNCVYNRAECCTGCDESYSLWQLKEDKQ